MEWKPKRSFQLTYRIQILWRGINKTSLTATRMNLEDSAAAQLVCTCRGVLPWACTGGAGFFRQSQRWRWLLLPRPTMPYFAAQSDPGRRVDWEVTCVNSHFYFPLDFCSNQAINLRRTRCSADWEESCVTKDGRWNCVSWDPTKRGKWKNESQFWGWPCTIRQSQLQHMRERH